MKFDRIFECDVLVIGAGVSGCCAAIQAGRCGCRTILLEKDEVLGGNSGPNLGVEVRGAQHYNDYAQETGIIQELEEEEAFACAVTPVRGMKYNISRRREAVYADFLKQAGVTVLKSHCARAPRLENGRITAVEAVDTACYRTVEIRIAHAVIDASGDGSVAAAAGAEFETAVEPRSRYGERSAPENAHAMIQGASMTAIACRTGHPVPFVPPEGTPPYHPRTWEDRLSFYYTEVRQGAKSFDGSGQFTAEAPEGTLRFLYFTEAGGDRDTIADGGAIYEQLLGQVWSFWNHVKNGPGREAAANWDLLWVSPRAGKRQSRRFTGDHVLTQNDIEAGRFFDDDIAYGGHNLDDHRTYGEDCSIFTHSIPPAYGIPFRCCYSRNVENLLFGGRLISASHIAHSSVRVMRTGGAIGQAVGLAAALCRRHGCSPREVYRKHLEELKLELQRRDGSLTPRRVSDPADLAPSATVRADCERRFNDQQPEIAVPMFEAAGAVLYDWPERIERVRLHLSNPSAQAVGCTLRFARFAPERRWLFRHEFNRFGRNTPDAAQFRELAAAEFTVPPGFHGWREVALPAALRPGAKRRLDDSDRLLVTLRSAAVALRWHMVRDKSESAAAVEFDPHRNCWVPFDAQPALQLFPPPAYGEAVNVTNGFNRRWGTGPVDQWIAPFRGEPLHLEFRWDGPRTVGKAILFFDDLERTPDDNPWRCGRRFSPRLVRDYSIEVYEHGSWRPAVTVSDNRRRWRHHAFPAVKTDRVRLTVEAVHEGGTEVRVCQVNLYPGEIL